MNNYLFQLVLHRAEPVCAPPLRPKSVDAPDRAEPAGSRHQRHRRRLGRGGGGGGGGGRLCRRPPQKAARDCMRAT